MIEDVNVEREKAFGITDKSGSEDSPKKADWRNKRTRRLRGQNRLRNLYNQTKTKGCSGASYDEDKNFFKKYSCNSKSLRQSCNRRFRRKMNRNLNRVPDGGGYRRYIDYWWILL